MEIQKINSFSSFCDALRNTGFSMSGRNNEGIFSLSTYFSDNINEHTGDKETDPWQWRIRVITEYSDLLYGKIFFNKGGWITKEWFKYFVSVRRGTKSLEEMYYDGLINSSAKIIYDLVCDTPNLSLQELKNIGGFDKSQKSEFEKALTDLQMKMFITISGEKHKLSSEGKEYGWPVTTFSKVEDFWGEDICTVEATEAIDKITERIYILNPNAKVKDIKKFIGVNKSIIK